MTAKGVAFITGGSSGIGLELARILTRRGMSVCLFARDLNKLNAASRALSETAPGAKIAVFQVDVSDRDACTAAVAAAIAQCGTPSWAVANAGIAEPGEFLVQPLSSHQAQIGVNYLGSLYFARAVAGAMAEGGGGRLVFVSSGAAFFGIYGYSAYAPSKFAIRGLAEVLRVELASSNISVSLAYPPDTDTPQLKAEETTKPAITGEITAGGGLWSAADVARTIIAGAEKGRFAIAPGFQMRALLILHSLIAPALRFWQGRIVRKHLRRHRKN